MCLDWWRSKVKLKWKVEKTVKNAYSYLKKKVLFKNKEKKCDLVNGTSNGGLWGAVKWSKKLKKVKYKWMKWNEYKLIKNIDMW